MKKTQTEEKKPLPIGIFRSKTIGILIYQTEKIWQNLKYGYVKSVF